MHESIRNSKWAFALVYNPKPKMFQIQIISSSSLYIQFLAIHLQGFIDLQALKIRPHQQDGTDDDQEDDGSNAAALQRYKMVDARLRRLCEKNLMVAAKFPNRYMTNGQLGADRGMSLELFLKSMTSTRSYSPVKHMLEPWKSWDCFMGILIPVLSVVELVAPCVLNMYNMHGEYFQMWFSLFPSMVYIQCQIQNNQHIAYQESPHLCLMYRLYNHLWFPFNPCRRSSCPRSAS